VAVVAVLLVRAAPVQPSCGARALATTRSPPVTRAIFFLALGALPLLRRRLCFSSST